MITVEYVTRTYGDFTAVDDVTFTAEPGRVTGFLGPNGAGKSTTMRIIVGLTPPDAGTAHGLGRRFADLPNPGLEVGVLLDASAQHAGRTGREVLTSPQRTMGLPGARVDEMLELVGLTAGEAARRVRDYSLGMRQRLGIAHALLGDPEVLILDEPANGLDPAGIRWMRGLLRGFADRGGTVLLSSHLLHEIEVIADDLVVIGQRPHRRRRAPRPTCSLRPAPRSAPATPTSSRAASRRQVSPSPTPPPRRGMSPVLQYPSRDTSCASTPTPSWPATAPTAPGSPSSSSAPPTAPAWRRCSSSSPQTPNASPPDHHPQGAVA